MGTKRKMGVEIEDAHSMVQNPICFICKNEQIPSQVSQFSMKSSELDASNGPSRLILFNILLKALAIKKLEVLKILSTNAHFPFCKNCLARVIEIIKIKQKIVQFEKDLKSLVDGLKNIIYSTSDDADQIFKDSLKNEDNDDEIENFPRAGQDDLRNIFRKAIIIDMKSNELLAQKISNYKKSSQRTNRKQLALSKKREREKLLESKFKVKLLKSSNQTVSDDNNQIEKNGLLDESSLSNTALDNQTSEDGQFSVENARDQELELSNDQNNQISTENSPLNEQIDSFNESYFSGANDNETSSSVDKISKEAQYSTISYKDFKSDYEKECSKNKVDNRKKRARRDSEEIPEIPEVFGSVPTSLTGNREGKLFYESYEIKCILEDPDNPKVQCVTCSKLFDVNQIKKKVQHTNPFIAVIDHIRAYHIGEFKCKQCNLMFKSIYILYLHVKNSVVHQPAAPTCEVCGMPSRAFNAKSMLRRHIWTHKSQQEKDELIRMGDKEPSKLVKNKPKKTKVPCPTCGILVTRNSLKNHINTHLGKFYKCEQCDKKFRSPDDLKGHVRKEHEQRSYEFFCQECNKYFSTKKLLETHKHYKNCTICDCPLQRKSDGKNKDTHFRCLQKKNSFIRMQAAKTIIKKPKPPPEPTTCNECGKTFSSKKNCKAHFGFVHVPYESRKFVCSYCDKRFVFEHKWNWHLNIHRKEIEFPCPYCGKIKYTSNHLRMHKKNCLRKLKRKKKWVNIEENQPSTSSLTGVKKIKIDETISTSSLNIIPDPVSPSPNAASDINPPLDNLDSCEPVNENEEDVKPTVECKYCIFRFFSNKELLDHYVELHKKQVFNCDPCKLVFISKGAYDKHIGTIFHEKNTKKLDQSSSK